MTQAFSLSHSVIFLYKSLLTLRNAINHEIFVTITHSCNVALPKKNGLSFLCLNSILSTWTCIDRDPMGRGRHSSPLSCRGGLCVRLCVCVPASPRFPLSQTQRGRWWERDVSGKAIERLSPPSDGVRLGFFLFSFSQREKEHKRLLFRFPEPVPLAKTPCPPRRAPIPPISGSQWGRTLEVRSYTCKSTPACLSSFSSSFKTHNKGWDLEGMDDEPVAVSRGLQYRFISLKVNFRWVRIRSFNFGA